MARDKKEDIVNIIQNCQPNYHSFQLNTNTPVSGKWISEGCTSYIKLLLDTTNDDLEDRQEDIVDQTELSQGDHTSKTSDVSSLSSLGPSFLFASHSTGLNDDFRTPDVISTYPSPRKDLITI